MDTGLLGQVKGFDDSQKNFLLSQVIASVYNNIVTGTMMTGLLLLIGIKPSVIGVFMSISLLANVFQILLGKMWDHFLNYENMINRMILVARLGIISIVFVPVILGTQGQKMRTIITGGILLFSYTFAASAGIHLNYWMVSSIPTERQGTFFAFRDRMVVGGTLFISFAASMLTDYLQAKQKEYLGFAFAFAAAALLAVTDYMVIKRIGRKNNVKRHVSQRNDSYKHLLKKDRRFREFIVYMFLLNLALNLANPYYNSYMLDHLKLKYTVVTSLTALQVFVQIIVSSAWAKIANKIRWSRILNIVVLILGIQFCIWALVTKTSLWLILIIFITSGLISTGLVTGQFMSPYEYIDHRNAMAYLSLCTSVSAIGGFTGSLIGSYIIRIFEDVTWKAGNLQFCSMQLNMLISGVALMGTVAYAGAVLNNKRYSI